MKAKNKKVRSKNKGWFSNAISRIKNGKAMKKLKGFWGAVSNCVKSCVSWVDSHEHKINSGLILGFGLMLLCPLVEPWTLVGIIALLVGVIRLLLVR